MKAYLLHIAFLVVRIIGITLPGNQISQAQIESTPSGTSDTDITYQTQINSESNSIPDARSVYESGIAMFF
jgi:hypothetical protein